MNDKLVVWAGALAVSVVTALILGHGVLVVGPQGQSGIPGKDGQNGHSGQSFGSLAGPDIPFNYLRWGGVGPIWHAALSPTATTTSGAFCSIPVPIGTSTVTLATWRPDSLTGIGGSAVFDISTSTTVSGSSTPALIANSPLVAAQVWEPTATTTFGVLGANPGSLGNTNVFTVVSSAASPLYLTWRIATTSGLTSVIPSSMTGNCQAEFIQL